MFFKSALAFFTQILFIHRCIGMICLKINKSLLLKYLLTNIENKFVMGCFLLLFLSTRSTPLNNKLKNELIIRDQKSKLSLLKLSFSFRACLFTLKFLLSLSLYFFFVYKLAFSWLQTTAKSCLILFFFIIYFSLFSNKEFI